jgi:integrase
MAYEQSYKGMSLFTQAGGRKYLSTMERERFLTVLEGLDSPLDRTFCEMLVWTGCRPSEALALCPRHIDLENAAVLIRSLKKRGGSKGRHIRLEHVPSMFIERLASVHGFEAGKVDLDAPLWEFSRTTAWRRIRGVMEAAGISGAMASAKGLRHTYGVHAALAHVPETRIKKWLGHAHLSTTEIYLDMAAPEDRAIATRMWPGASALAAAG